MRFFPIQPILFISIAACLAGASPAITAVDADAPELAPPTGSTKNSDPRRLFNLESNDKLWALLQYEAKFGKIEYTSLRKFGDFTHSNLRAVKAVGFNLASFDFQNSDLRGADLRQANLQNANFSGADLREVVLLSAKTEGALFDSKTKFPFSREEALRLGWKEIKR